MKPDRINTPDRTINLIIEQDSTFGRQIVQGIIAYVRKHPAWRISMHHAVPYIPWELLNQRPCNGIIAAAYSPENTAALAASGVPVVNVSSAELKRKIPTVHVDNHRIGQLGAQHLIEKGIERFVFVGATPSSHDEQRRDGFRAALQRKSLSCTEFFPALNRSSDEFLVDGKVFTTFLSQQKLPVGIMASHDRIAFGILDACRILGLQSPEQVAVIGCDNDETMCRLAHVTMSSIDPAAEVVGYEAAALLDHLMHGHTARPLTLIPPRGIEMRNSTDIRGIGDIYVSDTVRFIRDHAGELIDVNDVLNAIPLSRRALERRFGEIVGHGISEEIHRVHIERAKELLKHTDLSLTRIALDCGYHSVSRFQANFQRVAKVSAQVYRQSEGAR